MNQTATTRALSRPKTVRSLSDWCIAAAGGDSLLALDLAITAHAKLWGQESSAEAA